MAQRRVDDERRHADTVVTCPVTDPMLSLSLSATPAPCRELLIVTPAPCRELLIVKLDVVPRDPGSVQRRTTVDVLAALIAF